MVSIRCTKFRNYDVSPSTKHMRGVKSRVKKHSVTRDHNSIFFLEADPIPFLGLDLIDPRSSLCINLPTWTKQMWSVTSFLYAVNFNILNAQYSLWSCLIKFFDYVTKSVSLSHNIPALRLLQRSTHQPPLVTLARSLPPSLTKSEIEKSVKVF